VGVSRPVSPISVSRSADTGRGSFEGRDGQIRRAASSPPVLRSTGPAGPGSHTGPSTDWRLSPLNTNGAATWGPGGAQGRDGMRPAGTGITHETPKTRHRVSRLTNLTRLTSLVIRGPVCRGLSQDPVRPDAPRPHRDNTQLPENGSRDRRTACVGHHAGTASGLPGPRLPRWPRPAD
jgi:hypothetical protein